MSWQIFTMILDRPITKEFTSQLKFTALIYANYAKADGTDVYPSRETVARMTGYHERSIQRYQHRLVELGVIIPDGKGRMGTNKYKFRVTEAGDTQSPPHADMGDIPSGDIPSGDTQSPKPKDTGKERKKDDSNFPLSEIETVSKYWLEIAEQRPSKTLTAVFKRFFLSADKTNAVRGQMLSDIYGLVEKTFLNDTHSPEKYMIECIKGLLETYERYPIDTHPPEQREPSKKPQGKERKKHFPLMYNGRIIYDESGGIVLDDGSKRAKAAALKAAGYTA